MTSEFNDERQKELTSSENLISFTSTLFTYKIGRDITDTPTRGL